MQNGRREYRKYGLYSMKRALMKLGSKSIDRRYAVGKALAKWRTDITRDIGGDPSTEQAAIIDLAVKSKLILDSIDTWLLTRPSLPSAASNVSSSVRLSISSFLVLSSTAKPESPVTLPPAGPDCQQLNGFKRLISLRSRYIFRSKHIVPNGSAKLWRSQPSLDSWAEVKRAASDDADDPEDAEPMPMSKGADPATRLSRITMKEDNGEGPT
jgi:hypothetical protein